MICKISGSNVRQSILNGNDLPEWLIRPQIANILTKQDLIIGESTLKNIRLWDSEPLLDTNRQLQQLRK